MTDDEKEKKPKSKWDQRDPDLRDSIMETEQEKKREDKKKKSTDDS